MSSETLSSYPRPAGQRRHNCPVALTIFLIAYLAMLAVIFAPPGTFVSSPGAEQTQRQGG